MTARDNAKPLRPQRPKPVAESVSRSDGEADKRRNELKRFFDAVMAPGSLAGDIIRAGTWR